MKRNFFCVGNLENGKVITKMMQERFLNDVKQCNRKLIVTQRNLVWRHNDLFHGNRIKTKC